MSALELFLFVGGNLAGLVMLTFIRYVQSEKYVSYLMFISGVAFTLLCIMDYAMLSKFF